MKVKVNLYTILARAVAEGIEYGWRRAHKHTDFPQENTIKNAIETAIIHELCEVIDIEGGDVE